MINIYDYIKEDDMERKMTMILRCGRKIDEKCKTCEGLKFLHRSDSCTKSEAEKAQDWNLQCQVYEIHIETCSDIVHVVLEWQTGYETQNLKSKYNGRD